MAIIRSKRDVNFTVIDNCVFERNKLSFAAMGMLGYLLSKPDNWSVSVAELSKATEGTAKKSGRDAVYNILDELIAVGFVSRTKRSDGKMDYTVFDKPNTENPYYGKDVIREIPITEKPDTDNPTLINTETTTRTEKEITRTESARKEKSLPVKKATRIPDDWSAGEKELMFAKSYGFTPCEAEGMAIMFFNYFSNKTGKGSEWIDWHKTWQNWVIRESKSLKRRFSAPSNDNDFDFMAEMMRGCVNG